MAATGALGELAEVLNNTLVVDNERRAQGEPEDLGIPIPVRYGCAGSFHHKLMPRHCRVARGPDMSNGVLPQLRSFLTLLLGKQLRPS